MWLVRVKEKRSSCVQGGTGRHVQKYFCKNTGDTSVVLSKGQRYIGTVDFVRIFTVQNIICKSTFFISSTLQVPFLYFAMTKATFTWVRFTLCTDSRR